MKIKTIKEKANEIDQKANELSSEMSKHDYIITAEKVDIPLKKMRKVIRMMGFKTSETDAIMTSVKNDLVGKEMHKGDDFKKLIENAFTKAILGAVEEIKGVKNVVIQSAQKREIDDQIFKYVGVAGIDKPRIVQVGIHYTYFK